MADADNLMAPLSNAHISIAAKGSTAPAGATTTLDAAFTDLGNILPGSVSLQNSVSFKDIKAWGVRDPIKKLVDTIERGFSCSVMDWTREVVEFALGGGDGFVTNPDATGESMYEVPDEPDLNEKIAVVDWAIGDYTIRLVYPRVQLSSVDDIALPDDDAISIPIKISTLATSGLSPMRWLTDFPGLAAPSGGGGEEGGGT